jgi:LPXTG-site transpeptidase (sortase) family protein
MLHRALGYTLFCLGGGTLAYAAVQYATGEWGQESARRAWHEAEARAVVSLARREAALDGTVGVTPILEGAPVARIEIPHIGLDEIVMEGVEGTSLNVGPGHLPGSAFPGERGNAVISAHRDRHFSRLDELSVGDTVITESGARRNEWVVISKRIVDSDAPAIFRTAAATLTLTTCWPMRYIGTAPQRLIVTAKPIGTRSFANARTS